MSRRPAGPSHRDDFLPLLVSEPAATGDLLIVVTWQEFPPTRRPTGMRKRADKACYRNAQLMATVDSRYDAFVYAEGLALAVLAGEPITWVHHAWFVDPDGNAVDPTWKAPGRRYVGRVIPSALVVGAIAGSGEFRSLIPGAEIEALRDALATGCWPARRETTGQQLT